MKTTSSLLALGLILTLFACNHSEKAAGNGPADSGGIAPNGTTESRSAADTLYTLLATSVSLDTFEYRRGEPFVFMKTGNFLSANEKNAILISCPTDSTYRIELFTRKAGQWNRNDRLEVADAFPLQFDLSFKDFNFDGQTDIYVQCGVSNGYALSRGHLLIVDPETNKLQPQPEAADLANMQPDMATRTVISEDVDWSVDYGFQRVCDLENKWINGKLKTIARKCPSKNPAGYQ